MIASLRARRDRYEKAVLDASPLASYARLHLIAPIVLPAVVGCVLLGLLLPQGRQPEAVSRLIEGPAKRAYGAELKRLRQYRDLAGKSGAQSSSEVSSRVDAAHQRLIALARAEQLANCRWSDFFIARHNYSITRNQVICDGRSFGERSLFISFWLLLVCSAIAFFSWLYIQFRDSWMLPHWSPRLWYTPIYASVIGLIFCGPFLMVWAYHAKADATYAVAAREWSIGEPGMLLYVLAVLQVAAIVVASIDRRPRATYFAAGTGALAAVALGIYVLLEQTVKGSGGGPLKLAGWLLSLQVLLFVGARVVDRVARTSRLLRRVAILSAVLVVAWGLVALEGILAEVGLQNAVIESAIDTLCYLVVAVHLWSSQFSELELWRLGAD